MISVSIMNESNAKILAIVPNELPNQGAIMKYCISKFQPFATLEPT